jgi:hypothetical protein
MTLNNKSFRQQKAASCGLLQVSLLAWCRQGLRDSMEVLSLGRRYPGRDRFERESYKYVKVKVKQSLYRSSQF